MKALNQNLMQSALALTKCCPTPNGQADPGMPLTSIKEARTQDNAPKRLGKERNSPNGLDSGLKGLGKIDLSY
jgi:hypothetical protein